VIKPSGQYSSWSTFATVSMKVFLNTFKTVRITFEYVPILGIRTD